MHVSDSQPLINAYLWIVLTLLCNSSIVFLEYVMFLYTVFDEPVFEICKRTDKSVHIRTNFIIIIACKLSFINSHTFSYIINSTSKM